MELKEQRYVCTLAEYGNLTRAADRLYISQPALSIYISNLEKHLGTPLFDREGKQFELTKAGERYVLHARKILEESNKFNEELNMILSDEVGRLRLGISLLRGPWLLPRVLKAFGEKWPHVELTLRQGNIMFLNELLNNHELDMIIVNGENWDRTMEFRELFEEEFLVAVPQGHPLNSQAVFREGHPYGILAPEALNGQVILSTTQEQSSRDLQDRIFRKYQIHPSQIYTIRSIELILQMVAEGFGITLVREAYTKTFRYAKPVNLYQLDVPEHRRKVVAAFHRREKVPRYMEEMMEMLKKRGLEIMAGRL